MSTYNYNYLQIIHDPATGYGVVTEATIPGWTVVESVDGELNPVRDSFDNFVRAMWHWSDLVSAKTRGLELSVNLDTLRDHTIVARCAALHLTLAVEHGRYVVRQGIRQIGKPMDLITKEVALERFDRTVEGSFRALSLFWQYQKGF